MGYMFISTGQFTDVYYPVIDSISVIVRSYAYWLNRKYGRTTVITPNIYPYHDNESFDVLRHKPNVIPSRLKAFKFDILHAHTPFNAGKIAVKLSKELKRPVVGSCHVCYYNKFKNKTKAQFLIKYKMKKIVSLYNQMDLILTFDEEIADVLKFYGLKKRVEIIEMGSDFIYNENEKVKDIDYINHLYNINPEYNVLLYVGKLEWENNLRYIIEALSILREMRQRFRMLFVGEGKAKQDMLKLIEEKRLTNHVIFVGEITDREILAKYYSRANLLLSPVPDYSLGLSIREAASLRCPALLFKDSNHYVKDNFNGYLADKNSLSYAQRIISALNDSKKEEVEKAAQQTLGKNYEQIIDEIYEFYNELIKPRNL